MAALKCACIFWSIVIMVMYQLCYGKVMGCPVSGCGSICKIDLCLDMFGPYSC